MTPAFLYMIKIGSFVPVVYMRPERNKCLKIKWR